MKSSKSKFVVALLGSILAMVVSIVALVLLIVRDGFQTVATAMGFENFFAYLSFAKGTSFVALLPFIGTVGGVVFLILNLVLTVVKKDMKFIAPTLISAIAFMDSGYLAVALGSDDIFSSVYGILILASVGVSALFCLLTTIFLLTVKKESAVKEAVPFVAPAMEEEEEEEKEEEPVKAEEPVVEEEKEEPAPEEEEPVKEEEPVEEEAPVEEEKQEEVAPAPAPVAEKQEEPKPAPKKKAAPTEKKEKVLGKYEVFPEAGFYKYRLMANNGEILVVSSGYKTRDGAKNGIATLKKNVEGGMSKVITDKNGYSQFRIFTANDSRLVASGEFYATPAAAQKALASVERFYKTERIVDLDEIAEDEVREWKVDLPPVNPNKNGKFEVFIEEESSKWQARLVANNGAVLFITATYSSKSTLLNALANIKSKVLDGNIDIARDKMNRYHFHVISENGSILLMGETYPSRDSAISAAVSVRNFIGDAKVLDLTK
ncbi:MAG: YegP family protein [Bacilli bacterium]|nr:YegP family protein [Bacilli bacterium]